MYMKLLALVLCVTLFEGCFAAIGKAGGGLRGSKPGNSRDGSKSSKGPEDSVPGGGMGFGRGPGESDLNPAGEETIDIDGGPEGGSFAGFSGDNDDDEDRDGESGSGIEVPDKPCWQMKKDIMDRQVVGQFDPACTRDGHYQSRQCDRKRMCWCVDPNGVGLTGKTTHTETSVEECDRINRNGIERRGEDNVTPTPKPTEDFGYTDIKNDLDNMGPDAEVRTLDNPKSPNGVGSRTQEDETVQEADTSLLMGHPGILAGIIGGAVVGLLCAVLLVMFIVYRMRKKDEGSYALDEPRKSPTLHGYRPANQKEYYA